MLGKALMNLSLKPQHLKRYKDIGILLWKYGHSDMVQQMGLRATLDEEAARPKKGSPEELAGDLERMGPTFIKLGQLLSSRPDLLSAPYLEALSRLQDKVQPFPYEEVESILTSELGIRISKAFSHFEREPLAAASLGQVHRAALRDGRPVVVKVQRPGIRRQIAQDLEVLDELVGFLDQHTAFAKRYQLARIFEEFEKTLIHELDYHREAANLISIGANLRDFKRIRVPQPIMDYTTREVLTMEFIAGKKITELQPLERTELDGAGLADELFQGYLKQVLVDGLFHADPHPGNIFLTTDRCISLLDLGMIGRTTPDMQQELIRLLIAISEGKAEEAAEIAIKISVKTDSFDEPAFSRKIAGFVAEEQDSALREMDVGGLLLEVGRTAGQTGLFAPTELTLLGKTLLQLEQIGRILDENFSPNAAVRRHVSNIFDQRLKKEFSTAKLFSALFEVKDFVGGLPGRVNRILDAVGKSQLEVKVRATDAADLLESFVKIANRITTGLVLAALIVGAALLMQIDTDFQILGYPGIAILCFLAAALGGVMLIVMIWIHDHRKRK